MVLFDDRLCDIAERYLVKGSKVYLEGELQTRRWTDQSGQEKYSTEVVLRKFRGQLTILSGFKDDGGSHDAGNGAQGDLNDEIPF